ncbi:hypothetical protein E3N88_37140 [Mikania micrantha]|uniref:C3H1-type domain-containing protein n=1 Tax=Mikania micrantha TaxID=192012 RepID=A0A5N6M5K4_9ASTR|nr:hypothetical protein E3N88_37140 [Mikania micrantha]
MPTTAAAVGDRSPTASDSEEYEYEEIEIEEEIEVEEEVSDDDDDEEEEGEGEGEEEIEEVEEFEEEEEQENGSREDVSRSIEDRDDSVGKEKVMLDYEKASQFNGGILTEEMTNPIIESSQHVTVGDAVDGSDEIPYSEEQTKQINTKDVNDAHQKEHRMDVVMTAKTTNPINESSEQVFVGDLVDESGKVPESEEQITQMNTQDVNDARQKEELRLDVDAPLIKPQRLSPAMEINEGNKRSALVCDFYAKGWCIKGASCRFRHIKDPSINVVDQQNKPQKSQHQDEVLVAISGVREDTGRSDLATSAPAPSIIACSSELKPGSQKDNSNPITKLPVQEPPSNPFMVPNTHRSHWASHAPKTEEFGGKGYQHGFHNHNYNSSYHATGWPRTSAFLSSSSWKSDKKFSGYDWEPSKPFRSRFLISQGITTSDIQYDPIRDSIEQPTKVGDKLFKLSSSSHVPSISGTHSPLQEKLKTDYGSDRFSIGSHVNGNDNDSGMDVDSNEIADIRQENTESENKGKKRIRDVIQASEVHVGSHHSLQKNDGGPTSNNYKLDFDAEGDMHKESKSLRHFRAALIEFVKDLVKPTWRDGKLSKNAHKLVVKKTVDKVLTSLPPEHIPNIEESIDGYLTSSQPKLVKLVEVRFSH